MYKVLLIALHVASGAAEAGVQGVQLHTHYFAPFFIKD